MSCAHDLYWLEMEIPDELIDKHVSLEFRELVDSIYQDLLSLPWHREGACAWKREALGQLAAITSLIANPRPLAFLTTSVSQPPANIFSELLVPLEAEAFRTSEVLKREINRRRYGVTCWRPVIQWALTCPIAELEHFSIEWEQVLWIGDQSSREHLDPL